MPTYHQTQFYENFNTQFNYPSNKLDLFFIDNIVLIRKLHRHICKENTILHN